MLPPEARLIFSASHGPASPTIVRLVGKMLAMLSVTGFDAAGADAGSAVPAGVSLPLPHAPSARAATHSRTREPAENLIMRISSLVIPPVECVWERDRRQ